MLNVFLVGVCVLVMFQTIPCLAAMERRLCYYVVSHLKNKTCRQSCHKSLYLQQMSSKLLSDCVNVKGVTQLKNMTFLNIALAQVRVINGAIHYCYPD